MIPPTYAYQITATREERGRLVDHENNGFTPTLQREILTVAPSVSGRFLTIAALEALLVAARKGGAEDDAVIVVSTSGSTSLYPSTLSVNVRGGHA